MKLINFNDPKVMAYSGLIAMVPKIATTLIFSLITALLMSKPQAILALMVLWYPVAGSLIDLQLYKLKDKLWNKLPTNIPEQWDITPEQLLTYAKHLPKIRLMRWIGCWIILPLIPFMDSGNEWPFLIIPSIAEGFFIVSLFDNFWLNKFKIKKSKLITKYSAFPTRNKVDFWNDLERTRRINDATFPGSPAWFAQQAFNSKK